MHRNAEKIRGLIDGEYISRHFLRSNTQCADVLTRGTWQENYCTSDLWLHGPSWACEPCDSWPVSPVEVNYSNIPKDELTVSLDSNVVPTKQTVLLTKSALPPPLTTTEGVHHSSGGTLTMTDAIDASQFGTDAIDASQVGTGVILSLIHI